MWPWRDGAEAGVGGHADCVLSREPGVRGKQNWGQTGPAAAAPKGQPELLWEAQVRASAAFLDVQMCSRFVRH